MLSESPYSCRHRLLCYLYLGVGFCQSAASVVVVVVFIIIAIFTVCGLHCLSLIVQSQFPLLSLLLLFLPALLAHKLRVIYFNHGVVQSFRCACSHTHVQNDVVVDASFIRSFSDGAPQTFNDFSCQSALSTLHQTVSTSIQFVHLFERIHIGNATSGTITLFLVHFVYKKYHSTSVSNSVHFETQKSYFFVLAMEPILSQFRQKPFKTFLVFYATSPT